MALVQLSVLKCQALIRRLPKDDKLLRLQQLLLESHCFLLSLAQLLPKLLAVSKPRCRRLLSRSLRLLGILDTDVGVGISGCARC